MKDELTMMEDTPLPEDGKIDRSSPTKWVVLLVLLFLVPTLVIAAILAHQAPIDWLATDVVIGVLTALFCTLIAVALILSAQGKQARKLEQTLQPVTDVLAAVRAELTQFKSAIQSNNHYILNRITNLEKSQHELQKSEAKINSTIEEEQALLHQMTTVLKQGLADGFAATTGNHETLQVTVSRLQEANELISEQIIAIPKSQDEVKEGLEREIKLVAEKVAILLDAQEEMRNDLREDRQTFAGGMTDLATNQGHFQTTAETLQALMQSTASNTANIADEQAALHKLLRENISAQAKSISITQQCQEALENQVDRAEKISQQAAASLEATQAMRSTLRETVESKSEELAKQLVVLLNNQYALQAGVDRFDDRIGQAITEITTLSQEQASTNKTLHTQAEALSSQMSSLSTKHEQVIASVNHLKELAHAIDGNVTGVAGEQALLQENLQDNRHMLSSQIEGMERNIQNSLGGLHERAARLVANTEAFEGVQTNLCQSVETAKRELSGDMAGIQQSLQEGVGNLAERTSQMAADIDAVRATQADLRLTVETAGHELSDNITGVQQSLQERVGNLAERTTKMTADIDAVRTTQTDLRQALETIRHELSGDMACVQQSLQEGIGNLAERTTQMAADISSVSTAQSSLCQTVEANSEVVANKLTALLESQLTFHAGANAVSERTDLIVAKVSEVATGQVALSEALHNHIGAFSAEIPPLAADNAQLVAGVNDLRQLAQMVADTVAHVADEQAGSQEILKNNARVLADVVAFTEQNQKTIEVEVKRATEASRQMATTAAGMADEQRALHNMIRTTNDELIGQCGVLAENQRVLIGGVNSVGEEIAEATAKVAGVISGQSALAERVQVQAHDVIEQISALVTDQRQVRSDLGGLQEVAGEIAGDINRIADAQAEVQRTVCGRSDALDESMQRISQRQQSLEEEVGKVVQHNEANHGILTTIAVEQKALQDTFATDNREMHEQFSSLSEEQHNLRVELNKVAENCQEIAASANTIATHQTTLSTNINVKSQELHRLFSALAEGQQSLEVGIREVNDEVGRTVADMGAMGQEQAGLHGMTQNSVKEVKEHVDTLLAETQLQLREGLDELREVNRQVSDNITLRADNQNEKIETLQHETEKLLGQLSTLIGNHGQLHSHVNGLREIAQNMAGHIKVLMEDQVALQKTLRDSTAATAEENAIATEYQQALQAELGKIAETNSQAMALLTTLAAEQDTLRDLLRAGDEALADQVKGLAKDQAVFQRTQQESANATTENTAVVRQNQEVLQAELSKIAETNSQTMALLATLSAEQDALRDLLRAGDEALSDQVKGLAKDQAVFQRTQQESANATTENTAVVRQNQEVLQAELSKIAETNSQAMALLTTLSTEQDALSDLLRASDEALSDQVKGLAEDQAVFQRTQQESANATTENTAVVRQNQEVLQAELSKIAEANTQAMAVLATMAGEQSDLRGMIKTNSEQLAHHVMTLSEAQQTNMETWDTITRQVLADLTALNDRLVKMGEAIHAHGQDLATRFDVLCENQEQWLSQFENRQSEIDPLSERIDSLGQEVVSFQEILRKSIQDISGLLDAGNQQQSEFEDRVSQKLMGIVDSIHHIQEVSDSLQTQVSERVDRSRTHSEDIAWAIEQLKGQSTDCEQESISEKAIPASETSQLADSSFNIELGNSDEKR